MDIVQVTYQHPSASMPLLVPVLVLPNTPEHVADKNISDNSAKDLPWLMASEAHDDIAILCGGGASLKTHKKEIIQLKKAGGTIFGLNGAAKWLVKKGIDVDIQTVLDAKKETATLVEPKAKRHIFSSQCHNDTVDAVNPTIFHLNNIDIEKLLPEERVKKGGYVLIGGGVSVGITTMVLAYAMGYRELHLFGYDSCNKDGNTHVYPQDMNQFIPIVSVEWGKKTYSASMPMKIQAEAFPRFAAELKRGGCEIELYGEGLLQAMYGEPPATEQQKYKLMWSDKRYRTTAPGEDIADTFIDIVKPTGTVIDFGCGTGRGAKAISEKTDCQLVLIDFADNCRDKEVAYLPFIEWDLTKPCPASSDYGYCTDVMEHIPTKDVDAVISNITNAAQKVFFQISTVDDYFGNEVGYPLHLTVKPYSWWVEKFNSLGCEIIWSQEQDIASLFYVTKRK
jgi:uncharacterized Rossmann fold enzyme